MERKLPGKKLPCDFIEDAILVVDRNRKVVFANRTLLRNCDLVGGDITGVPCHVAFHHSLLPCTENCPHSELFSSGKTLSATYIRKGSDGRERTFEVNATPVFDEKGEIAQMVEIFRDVTVVTEKTAPQKEQNVFLHAILDAFNGGVVVVDREMRVITANRSYLAGQHLKLEDVTGRFCYEAFRHSPLPCSKKGDMCPARETFRTGLPSEAIHVFVDENGTERFSALKSYPVKDEKGKVLQVVETLYDITEKAESEIKEKIRIIEMKEELELLKEEMQQWRGSPGKMSPATP